MILPAVVKYAFRSVSEPENVRAVAVPPTVIPVPGLPAMTPSAIVRVTVHGETESTSPKGVPENSRLPATSSVTVKFAGAEAVGLSLTGVMLIRDVAGGFDDSDGESLSEITVVKVRAEVLFRAVV